MTQESREHFLAVVAEGVESGFEHGSQTATREQLLHDVGDEQEQDVSLGRHGIVAVHVFQSEATENPIRDQRTTKCAPLLRPPTSLPPSSQPPSGVCTVFSAAL